MRNTKNKKYKNNTQNENENNDKGDTINKSMSKNINKYNNHIFHILSLDEINNFNDLPENQKQNKIIYLTVIIILFSEYA